MYDIIIVGAGPAGLTAAIYGRRANKKVLVLEAKTYGGQIINVLNIENYPVEASISGFDFATKLYEQAKALGAEIKFEKVIEIKENKEVITNKDKYQGKTVIIATGSDRRKLGINREEELIGKGISYCATCDGAFYKNKDVAVVGSDDVALEDTEYLSNIANKVYLINKKDNFKGYEDILDKLSIKKNIEILYNSNVTKLNGDKRLESVTVNDKDIPISGLFVCVGRVPETENFKKLFKTNNLGYAVSGEDCHTNIEGIYVAGDMREKLLRQLVTATSDGAIAATEAVKYINKNK